MTSEITIFAVRPANVYSNVIRKNTSWNKKNSCHKQKLVSFEVLRSQEKRDGLKRWIDRRECSIEVECVTVSLMLSHVVVPDEKHLQRVAIITTESRSATS